MNLLIANASKESADYAVKNWHYSRCLPVGKLVKFGVWEDKKFIGVVIFSRGASPHLGKALDLDQTEVCELTRVALDKHDAPVSQIVAKALTELKKSNPALRAVISFADPKEGHIGGIYKAGNWIYTGKSNEVTEYFIEGRWMHTRNAYHHPKRPTAAKRTSPGKFRYIYPLDRVLRKRANVLSLPYPNAIEGLKVSRKDSVFEEQVQSLPIAPKV
jgi:hypothetical protein